MSEKVKELVAERYDQTAKHLLKDFLKGAGMTDVQHEVMSGPHHIDVLFCPSADSEARLKPLGLISRIVVQGGAFEAYHNSPDVPEVLLCFHRFLSWRFGVSDPLPFDTVFPPDTALPSPSPPVASDTAAPPASSVFSSDSPASVSHTPAQKPVRVEPALVQLSLPLVSQGPPDRREALGEHVEAQDSIASAVSAQTGQGLGRLWIFSARHVPGMLSAFGCTQRREWSQGVFEAVPALDLWIVSISRLPRTYDTLFLRLMGRDDTLKKAVEDLKALPDDDPLKTLAEPILYRFHRALRQRPRPSSEDIMEQLDPYFRNIADAEAYFYDKGIRDGEREGRVEGERAMLLKCLETKFPGGIPWQERIAKIQSIEVLEQLFILALNAPQPQDIIDAIARLRSPQP